MNINARPIAEINLEEFERRLRAAGTSQSKVEDPLEELTRLVNVISRAGASAGAGGARFPLSSHCRQDLNRSRRKPALASANVCVLRSTKTSEATARESKVRGRREPPPPEPVAAADQAARARRVAPESRRARHGRRRDGGGRGLAQSRRRIHRAQVAAVHPRRRRAEQGRASR